MSLHPRGRLWPSLAKGLLSLHGIFRARDQAHPLADLAEIWAARVWKAPANLREKIHERIHRAAGKWGRGMSVHGLLAALGRRPRWLLGDYLEDVGVDPRARGFFHDDARNVTWGYSIGIDLIPSHDGVWCVEANLNTGAYYDGYRHLWNSTAAIEGLFQAAEELKAETVWWHGMDRSRISPWLMQTLEDMAGSAGMDVIIREDFRARPRDDFPPGILPPQKRLMSPTVVPKNTLVVRRNCYGVGSDFVVSNKEPFIRGMQAELLAAGDTRCRVPPMTKYPPKVEPPRAVGLPNLVYKYPDASQGMGVFFMCVADPEQAVNIARRLDRERGEPPGLFQPFVCSRILPGRRVYDVRCELIVTPLGARKVLGIRRESTQAIPREIGLGLFPSDGVFTSNMSTGGRTAPLGPSEEQEIEDAALAVGEALVRLLSRGFRTT
jgi:hypothetical protein